MRAVGAAERPPLALSEARTFQGRGTPLTLSRGPILVAIASALLVLAVTAHVPQGVFSDPAWQLVALRQALTGHSPSLLASVTPDTADLTREYTAWGSWWAPGVPLAVYPLLKYGLSIGAAVRLIVVLCYIIGAIGWAVWASRFRMPVTWTLVVAGIVPWLHYATEPFYSFSAESFVFASVPYGLLGTLALSKRLDTRGKRWDFTSFALGLLLGSSYVLKYSAVVPMIGAGIYLATRGARLRILRRVALAGVGGVLPIAILSTYNRTHGAAANLVSASVAVHFSWRPLAFAVSNPILMLTDADAFLRYVLRNPSHPVAASDDVLFWIGLPGMAVLVWLLTRRWRSATEEGGLALSVALCTILVMLVLWTLSSGVSFEARHFAATGLALLPLCVREGLWSWRTHRSKLLLSGSGACYLALPAAFGVASVAGKAIRPSVVTGMAHIANPLLSTRSIPDCVAALLNGVNLRQEALYLIDPGTALDLPVNTRTLIVQADFTDIDLLSRKSYRAARPLTLHLFLPPRFEQNAKGRVIRDSFNADTTKWRLLKLPQCEVNRWTTTVGN